MVPLKNVDVSIINIIFHLFNKDALNWSKVRDFLQKKVLFYFIF